MKIHSIIKQYVYAILLTQIIFCSEPKSSEKLTIHEQLQIINDSASSILSSLEKIRIQILKESNQTRTQIFEEPDRARMQILIAQINTTLEEKSAMLRAQQPQLTTEQKLARKNAKKDRNAARQISLEAERIEAKNLQDAAILETQHRKAAALQEKRRNELRAQEQEYYRLQALKKQKEIETKQAIAAKNHREVAKLEKLQRIANDRETKDFIDQETAFHCIVS